MLQNKHELQTLAKASLEVQFGCSMAIYASLFKITKKQLKKIFQIKRLASVDAKVTEKGKVVTRTFNYGFRGFILRKRGKERQIFAPHPDLQQAFAAINAQLPRLDKPHKNAFGFVKKRSPQKAVRTLLGNTHYIGFDLADAFPSVMVNMLEAAFKRLKISETAIWPLAWLVTYYHIDRRQLPQGSSCSPALLNLVLKPMCQEIDRTCKNYGLKWFIYADDVNIAGANISPQAKEELMSIPAKYGFAIKASKTKDNLGKTIPHMLGLAIVAGKIHIRRRKKNEFRRILFMAWKYGAYSPDQVRSIAQAIEQTYGPEENWPGWLKEYWAKYQMKNWRLK